MVTSQLNCGLDFDGCENSSISSEVYVEETSFKYITMKCYMFIYANHCFARHRFLRLPRSQGKCSKPQNEIF